MNSSKTLAANFLDLADSLGQISRAAHQVVEDWNATDVAIAADRVR